ncbi:MAG TPA: outer membrane beta-barrel protein [Bacteroidales bacterium]|nr:outer membrane beta-barrel protein [Bacteroidales bacterium]
MDEHSTNIDLIFRNGLKDMEALPPPEVWENIKPVIRKKQRPYILFATAAMIAILLSLSMLAYRWSRQVTPVSGTSQTALRLPSSSPLFAPLTGERKLPQANGNGAVKDLPPAHSDNITFVASAMGNSTDELPTALYSGPGVKLIDNERHIRRSTLMKVPEPVNEPALDIEMPSREFIPSISTTKPTNRWSLAAMASPTYYSRFGSSTDEMARQMKSSEETMLSYSGGLALSYKINKRLSVQTGLYYSSIGQKVDGIVSYGGFQPFGNSKGGHNFAVLTSSGTIYTDNSDIFLMSSTGNRVVTAYNSDVFDPQKENLQYINNTLHQDFSYLELPVVLRYKVVDRTLGFNLIGGISYNFLVSNDVYTTYNGGKYDVGTTQGLNPFTLSSSLGMGMEYNFSKNLSLNLEPTFRYYINPFSSSTGLRNHPYSFGLFSGISFKF